MTDFLAEMSKPQFTGWMVLVFVIVFAYIGGLMGDDDEGPGGNVGA